MNLIMNMKLQNPRSLSFLNGFSRFKAQYNQRGKIYIMHIMVLENERFEFLTRFEELSWFGIVWLQMVETDVPHAPTR